MVYLETLNTTELLRALQERNITAFAVVPQFFYLIHERIFQEVAKRGALTQKVFKSLMRVNRMLRKVGINAGPILFSKVHETLGNEDAVSGHGRVALRSGDCAGLLRSRH